VNVGLDFDLNHPPPQDPNTSFVLDPDLQDLICSPGFWQEVNAAMALGVWQQQLAVGPALDTASPDSDLTLLDFVNGEQEQAQIQASDQPADPFELDGQLDEFAPIMRHQVLLASTAQSPNGSDLMGSSKALYGDVGLEQNDQGCVASSFSCRLST
jgi:hypothetical protein